MFTEAKKIIDSATNIIVIQAENPDGDSVGSALALEEILSDIGKSVSFVQSPSQSICATFAAGIVSAQSLTRKLMRRSSSIRAPIFCLAKCLRLQARGIF